MKDAREEYDIIIECLRDHSPRSEFSICEIYMENPMTISMMLNAMEAHKESLDYIRNT